MKALFAVVLFLLGFSALAQEAVVDISLHPAGSFQVKSSDVRGYATQDGETVSAKDIKVGLKNAETGIGLRDTHTRKHLEVDKYPDATLVSATGSGGKGTGVLRIRDVERPISGTYEVNGSTLTAHFNIKLSEFKFESLKYMGVGVDNTAVLTVKLPLKKTPSQKR
jgi:polyisoprenoid-binding protein YceI